MKTLFTLILSACIFTSIFSQSDDCATATFISSTTDCSSPIAGTTAGATQSMPGCVGTADDDVWYQFTAAYSSAHLTIMPSINFDAVVEVFTGTCGSLTTYSCTDQSSVGGDETVNLTGLTVGSTYYFRVYEYYTNTTSPAFSVCLTASAPPSNDNCLSAITLTSTASCSSPVINSSFGATESMPGCAGTADDDIWYQFTATASSHSISVTGSSSTDPVLEVFSGSCSSLTSLYCLDNSGYAGTESVHLGSLTIGGTYYFRVYNYYANSAVTDSYTICLTDSPPLPANDDCAGALSVSVTTNCNVVNTVLSSVGAIESMPGCAGTADDDVWCKFVAINANQTINVTGDVSADAVVELFSGSCSSLTSLSCTDNTGTSVTESAYVSNLTVGQTYYFRIYDYYSTGGHTFTVSIVTREINIASTADTICSGNSVTLTASGTPTYTWSNGVVNGVAFSPTVTTTYSVSGVGSGSCVNTASVTITVSTPQTPAICMVTVDTLNANNVIYWDKSGYDNVDSMIIHREVVANTYQRIGAVDEAAFSRFIDTVRHIGFRNGDPNIRSYKYKLQIRDTCGNYSALSPYHTSLFLNNTSGNFTWDFYDIEAQASPVNNYELYRDDNNTGVFNLIGTVTASLGVSTYSLTDPNFATYASSARWGLFADGFSCYPSFRGNGTMSTNQQIIKAKSNVKNNYTIPQPPADPDPQSVRELNLDSYVQLMPNPTTAYFSVACTFNLKKISIYNNLGSLIQSVVINNHTQSEINVQELSNGIYSVEIVCEKGRIVKKLVINR